jgi:hypothetical protein
MPVFGNQQAQILVDLPNGKTDENPQNNEQTKNFNITNGEAIQFSISESAKNEQMTWSIKQGGQTVLNHTQTPSTSNSGMAVQEFCLAKNECYEFSLEDAFVSDLCSQYEEWNAATTYQVGDRFMYQGKVYEATATIWGVDPISFYQYFKDLGPCPSPNPTDKFELKNMNQNEMIISQQVSEYTGSTTKSFCVSIVNELSEQVNQQVLAYPNPTPNGTIYFSQRVEEVQVFDMYGKEVFRDQHLQEIQLMNLGVYFLHIISTQGVQTVKVTF